MKKIILAITLAAGLAGCSDYLDVNKDPNYPTTVPAELILPSAQGYIAGVVGGNMYNYGGIFAQYLDQTPEANQYNELTEYRFKTDMFSRDYSNLYAGALKDLENVRAQSTETEAWGDYFVATVLRVYSYQLLVDLMDKVPYTEALQGSSIPMPKWDDGEVIYAGLLQELDEAEAKLNSASKISADIVLSKDLNQWIGFANAMRLKLYMRASFAQDNSSQIKALIENGKFFTGDVMFDNFTDDPNKRNPWYTTNKVELANNHVGSYPIITYMKAASDPRLPLLYVKASGTGEYNGEIPGSKSQMAADGLKNAQFSFPVYNATLPVYFYTQSELQFFLAEAYVRFFKDDAKAKAAYEKAINENFRTRGINNDASVIYGTGKLGDWSSATTEEAKLKLIATQKWVSLCMINNIEGWIEARRTGYPSKSSQTANAIYKDPTVYTIGELIAPMINGLGTELVQRVYYPQSAVNLNQNTPAQAQLTDKIWWDKK